MTSNSFQFAFWILFNYVYSLNKPETINEIGNNSKGKLKRIWRHLVKIRYSVLIKSLFILTIGLRTQRKFYLTIRRAQVVYEQIINEAQLSWLSLIDNEGKLSNCFSINQLVGQNVILKNRTETSGKSHWHEIAHVMTYCHVYILILCVPAGFAFISVSLGRCCNLQPHITCYFRDKSNRLKSLQGVSCLTQSSDDWWTEAEVLIVGRFCLEVTQ